MSTHRDDQTVELLRLANALLTIRGTGTKYAGMGLWLHNEAHIDGVLVQASADGFSIRLTDRHPPLMIYHQDAHRDQVTQAEPPVIQAVIDRLNKILVLDRLAWISSGTTDV